MYPFQTMSRPSMSAPTQPGREIYTHEPTCPPAHPDCFPPPQQASSTEFPEAQPHHFPPPKEAPSTVQAQPHRFPPAQQASSTEQSTIDETGFETFTPNNNSYLSMEAGYASTDLQSSTMEEAGLVTRTVPKTPSSNGTSQENSDLDVVDDLQTENAPKELNMQEAHQLNGAQSQGHVRRRSARQKNSKAAETSVFDFVDDTASQKRGSRSQSRDTPKKPSSPFKTGDSVKKYQSGKRASRSKSCAVPLVQKRKRSHSKTEDISDEETPVKNPKKGSSSSTNYLQHSEEDFFESLSVRPSCASTPVQKRGRPKKKNPAKISFQFSKKAEEEMTVTLSKNDFKDNVEKR